MTAPAMIDLGDLGEAGAAARSHPSWRWRTLLVVALVPLCLAGVTGARPSLPGLSRPLWAQPAGTPEFVIGANSVYETRIDGTLVARDLWTGRTVWTIRFGDSPVDVLDAGDLAIVIPRFGGDTALIDRSGTVAATVPGTAVGITRSGRRLVLVDYPERDHCPIPDGACGRVSAWDLATRTPVWSADVRIPVVDVDAAGRVDAVATIAADGTIEVRDPDTGAIRDRLRPLPAGVAAASGTLVIFFRGDVVTAVPHPDAVEVTLYRPRAIGWPRAGAWAVRVPVPARAPDGPTYDIATCGRMLCAEVGGATTVIDPDRGRTRVTTPDRVIGDLGTGLLLATSWIYTAGDDCLSCWDLTLVDPDGGGDVATFPGSTAVPWVDSGGEGLFATAGVAGTGFTVLEPDGTVRPIGTVSGEPRDCAARRAVLVCFGAGTLRAWRLPS
jgi:hypothetical protein